jgi:gas vesicle protein
MRDHDDLPYIVIERRGEGRTFVLGVLVGFGAALLLAPRAGADTRQSLLGAALSVREALGDRVDGARGAVQERVTAVRGAVDARREQARAAVATGRGAARDARADLLRRVEEAKALRRSGRAPGAVEAPPPPEAELVVLSVDTETDAGELAR